MPIASHVLLTTDFSEASEAAVAKAGKLARFSDAKLTVLHVHSMPPGASEAMVTADPGLTTAGLENEALEALERMRTAQLGDISAVSAISLVTVEHASPPIAICEFAKDNDVDLIVIGTHGRTGISHLLIGSVAERVVRHADCAVLVVPRAKD